MSHQTFEIKFEDYLTEENKSELPEKSGVYCVFSRVKSTEEIKKLIYIGESGNVNDRIDDHERLDDWNSHVKRGQELCYSFGYVKPQYRVRCEAAMIFKHEPPENTEYVDSFPFDKTTMKLRGKTAELKRDFTVDRTD